MNRIIRAAEALGLPKSSQAKQALAKIVVFVMTLATIGLYPALTDAANLGNASLALSDPRPSQTSVNYTFTLGSGGSPVTSSAVKCIKVVYATTSTDTAGVTGPSGLSDAGVTTASLASSTLVNSSATGWTATPSGTTNNIIKYTNSTGVTPGTTTGATLVDNLVTNSSVQDTAYFAFFNTYGNTDCATTPIDNATVEFINTNGSLLSLTVDNTLSFTVNAVAASQSCGGGTTTQASFPTSIPFGTVTAAVNGLVCQDLTAATNATNGYTIYTRYTAPPTNALSQTIADWTGSNTTPTTFSAPGVEAYGYTTNDQTLGTGTANRFYNGSTYKYAAETTSNAELAYEPNGVTSTTYRIGHQVGISLTTHPGTYTTTIIYTCTPIY